jgi:chromosome segregation ATPase
LGVDAQTTLISEIARLKAEIDRAAAATEITLAVDRWASADEGPRSASAEHTELSRQLGALRERVARAEQRNEGPGALRAELATLLFFAGALQADAEGWRAGLEEHVKVLQRRRTAARHEQERLAAEHEDLVRRRDALQSTILQTAARVAQQYRGECRRTLPVFTLRDGLTVCSVSVSCPRRGFRFAKHWLVTLTRSQDVLVRRE